MYGYIYKTTNLVDGKIYIGQKKSSIFLGQKYLGSGKNVRRAIKKYGKHNFKVELIEEIENVSLMDEREIYWVSYYKSTDKSIGYNISEGGKVNRTMVGENNPFYGKHHAQETLLKNSLYHKGRPAWNKGLTKETDERVAKYAESNSKKKHKRGVYLWVVNITTNSQAFINIDNLEEYYQLGYVNGRLPRKQETKNKMRRAMMGKIRVHKGELEKNICPQELDSYIQQGWIKGRKKFKHFNKRKKQPNEVL